MPYPRRRVLCAEPHEDTCRLITMLLERQGHEVVPAQTAEDCVRLADAQSFDLYMLDDDYIDGTAIQLCKRLREMTPGTNVSVEAGPRMTSDRGLRAEVLAAVS